MTRRRIIWGLVTFVVALTVGLFLVSTARADVPSPLPQAPPIPPDPTAADAFGDYGFAFVVLALVIYHLIVGLWKASRVVRRAATWVRSRPSADADEKTVDEHADEAIEATHECPPNGPCAWCVSRPVTGWVPTPQWVAAQDLNEIEASWALPVAEPRRTSQ